MKNYNDLKEIQAEFENGTFKFDHKIMLKGVEYTLNRSSAFELADMLSSNARPHLIYSASGPEQKRAAKAAGLDEWLVFIWAFNHANLHIQPSDVKITNQHRLQHALIKEEDNKDDPRIIGDSAEVKFTGIGNSPTLKGKVDTGASISSLHADRYKVDKEAGTVTFVNSEISPNTITVPLADHAPIRSSDGGTEYRPVIRLNVKINDQPLQDIAFNLNDRAAMDTPILIGQNILEKGRFLIDPMREGVEEEDPELELPPEEGDTEGTEADAPSTERDLADPEDGKKAPDLEDVLELIQGLIAQRKADAESSDVELDDTE